MLKWFEENEVIIDYLAKNDIKENKNEENENNKNEEEKVTDDESKKKIF